MDPESTKCPSQAYKSMKETNVYVTYQKLCEEYTLYITDQEINEGYICMRY
jgi:hypothetical protein